MASLISLSVAKRHLKGVDFDDFDLELKCAHATAMALDYIERTAEDQSPAWTMSTNPSTDPEFAILQAGILIVLMDLCRFRGDDDEKAGHVSEFEFPPRAARILRRLKEPTLA